MTVESDLDRMMAVMDAAFDPFWGEAWNVRQLRDSLAMPTVHYAIADRAGGELGSAEEDDAAAAAGFFLVRAAPGEEELLLVAVDPACRGNGIGKNLMDRFIGDATERGATRLFLEARENNPAISLYRRCGFEPVGRRPNYYRTADGGFVDAITFARNIEV